MANSSHALNRKEEGRLPSKPMVNPKNAFDVGSSSQPHDTYHEQVKMVVTLRNGPEVGTRPEELKKDVREPTTNPKGFGVEMVSNGKEVTPPNSSSVLALAPHMCLKPIFPLVLKLPLP